MTAKNYLSQIALQRRVCLYDDIFKDVTVKDYTYQRTFTMQEVIYLKYNNNKVTHFVESLFEDYGKIFGRMIGATIKTIK